MPFWRAYPGGHGGHSVLTFGSVRYGHSDGGCGAVQRIQARTIVTHDVVGMRVVVLVKAAPVLTQHLDETMCVAGARVDGDKPEWVRLHPVPFRDLATERRFVKYQQIEVDVTRPRADRRPESWSPRSDNVLLRETLGTSSGWADRRALVDQLREANMCDLVEANRSGSGPETPSLAVVRPAAPPQLLITERDEEQLERWRQRAAGATARVSLFDDPESPMPNFEVVPWRFRYRYKCQSVGCRNHEQTIVDWEAAALWRNVRYKSAWRELMRHKFEEQMWSGRASALFVGNMEQRPWNFLVLGIFWPPDRDYQPRLDL